MSTLMKIKDYASSVKKSFSSSKNQGRFMREIFKAAGSNRFTSAADDEYTKKICNGSKPITEDMIAEFPRPYRIDALAKYYVQNIDKGKTAGLVNDFGLQEDEEVNVDYLGRALAAQFFCFVEAGGAEQEVEDIVASSYDKLKGGMENSSILATPYYKGDRVWILNEQEARHYDVGFYEKFKHSWRIKNDVVS